MNAPDGLHKVHAQSTAQHGITTALSCITISTSYTYVSSSSCVSWWIEQICTVKMQHSCNVTEASPNTPWILYPPSSPTLHKEGWRHILNKLQRWSSRHEHSKDTWYGLLSLMIYYVAKWSFYCIRIPCTCSPSCLETTILSGSLVWHVCQVTWAHFKDSMQPPSHNYACQASSLPTLNPYVARDCCC